MTIDLRRSGEGGDEHAPELLERACMARGGNGSCDVCPIAVELAVWSGSVLVIAARMGNVICGMGRSCKLNNSFSTRDTKETVVTYKGFEYIFQS